MDDFDVYHEVVDQVSSSVNSSLTGILSRVHDDYLSFMSSFFGLSALPSPSRVRVVPPGEVGYHSKGSFFVEGGRDPLIRIAGPRLVGGEWMDVAFWGSGLEFTVKDVVGRIPDFEKVEELVPYVATLAHESGHYLHRLVNPSMTSLGRDHAQKYFRDKDFFPWAQVLTEVVPELSAMIYLDCKDLLGVALETEDIYMEREYYRMFSNFKNVREAVSALSHLSSSKTFGQAMKNPPFKNFLLRDFIHFKREAEEIDEYADERSCLTCVNTRNPRYL